MEDIMVFIWLAFTVIAMVCEALTVALVAIWFVPAALIATILAAFGAAVWVQALVFFILSAMCITVFCTFFRKKILARQSAVRTNSDTLIGQRAIVTETIDNLAARGAVKVNGQEWSARSADDTAIEAGQTVEILSIQGVKLVCKSV